MNFSEEVALGGLSFAATGDFVEYSDWWTPKGWDKNKGNYKILSITYRLASCVEGTIHNEYTSVYSNGGDYTTQAAVYVDNGSTYGSQRIVSNNTIEVENTVLPFDQDHTITYITQGGLFYPNDRPEDALLTKPYYAECRFTFDEGGANSFDGRIGTTPAMLSPSGGPVAAIYRSVVIEWNYVNIVTATFNPNGGKWKSSGSTDPKSVEVTKGQTPSIETPTRDNHTFLGWSPAIGPIYQNTTYTAQWSQQLSVTYRDDFGGEYTENVQYGTEYTIKKWKEITGLNSSYFTVQFNSFANKIADRQYLREFKTWHQGQTYYSEGQVITVQSSLNLSGEWGAATLVYPSPSPSKPPYLFQGWMDIDGAIHGNNTSLTKDLTLYALWAGGSDCPIYVMTENGWVKLTDASVNLYTKEGWKNITGEVT